MPVEYGQNRDLATGKKRQVRDPWSMEVARDDDSGNGKGGHHSDRNGTDDGPALIVEPEHGSANDM